jgi:hypothetical protein
MLAPRRYGRSTSLFLCGHTGLTSAAAPVGRDMGPEMAHRLTIGGNESRHHRTDVMDAAPLGRPSAVLEFAATDHAAGVAPPSTPCVTWSMFRMSVQNSFQLIVNWPYLMTLFLPLTPQG